jgi:hypothetical protein
MATKCNTCGGTYTSVQPDGSHYFHACAPIDNPAYQPDPKKGAVNLQQTIERPNKRDENITGTDTVTSQPVMVSAGAGVTTI